MSLEQESEELIGFFPDMSNEDYHGHEGSYSRSALMQYKKSPYHYWAFYLNPARPPTEQTKALTFGSPFHEYILEPHLFNDHFDISPPIKRPVEVKLKDVGKELFDAYKIALSEYKAIKDALKCSDKIMLTGSEIASLEGMRKALEAHDTASRLLEDTVKEQSYFWKDLKSGLLLKCRPDVLHEDYIVDLKTCADASLDGMQRSVFKYGYDMQAAMMLDGINAVEKGSIDTFILICVEKKYPFMVGVYFIDDDVIQHGRDEYQRLAIDLKNSVSANVWPGHETESIIMPNWMIKQKEKRDQEALLKEMGNE